MIKRKAILRLTNKCNLQCRHCCYSCSLKGETMSMSGIEAAVSHLPFFTSDITLTGGEVFAEKEKLRHALRCIRENKMKLPFASVSIQTNGFWAKDADSAYSTLNEMLELGVDSIIFGSIDDYHKEQGLDIGRIKMRRGNPLYEATGRIAADRRLACRAVMHSPVKLETILEVPLLVLGLEVMNLIEIANNGPVTPFGRAKYLPEECIDNESECDAKGFPNEITIAPDGKVYPCCWEVTAAIGSAFETPLRKLIAMAEKDPVIGGLIREGPKEAAKAMGIYNPREESWYKRNPCVICEKIFRGMR